MHGQNVADRVSKHISEALSELKKFSKMGISMREQYDLDCDYYMFLLRRITLYTESWMIWL